MADVSDDVGLLRQRLAAGDALDERTTYPGHVTTSAVILDGSGSQVLMVHHRASGRWLQPGGHWEPAPDFAASAEREAMEETGLARLTLHPLHGDRFSPIDIDTHDIPARPSKGEPAHVHFDLRFVFIAPPDATLHGQDDEVAGVRWVPVSALASVCPRVHRRLGLPGII